MAMQWLDLGPITNENDNRQAKLKIIIGSAALRAQAKTKSDDRTALSISIQV